MFERANRRDSFVTTCGRTGVDEYGSIQVHLDGDDGWRVTTIEVNDGIQSWIFYCNFEIDDFDTCTCGFDDVPMHVC